MDFSRLIALLNLSTSDNDNEALSATRHANAWLKKNSLRWEDVLGSGKSYSSYTPPPKDPPKDPPKSKWTGGKAPEVFDSFFVKSAYASTKFHEFLVKKGPGVQRFMLSLHGSFMKWNRLTDKQYKVFADIWDEFIRESI